MQIPEKMPDFDTAVSAAYETCDMLIGDYHGIGPGRVVIQPRRCNNPECDTGCLGVTMSVTTAGFTLEVELEAGIAVGLASLILHAAHVADPSLKEGAN